MLKLKSGQSTAKNILRESISFRGPKRKSILFSPIARRTRWSGSKKYPLFDGAIVDDMQDGRFIVTSKWFPHDNTLIEIEWVEPENELMRQAKYFRQRAVISPRNTIYENVGFNPREGRD